MMVQLGDFHIGKTQSAVQPSLNIMEASVLWDALVARYKCIEETQIYHKYVHDTDFNLLLKFGVDFLKKQVDTLEKEMVKYQLPMPPRPPMSINDPESSNMVLTDQYMFSQIFEGCQMFIDYFARATRTTITNDSLRKVFADFLTEELMLFDKLCKFAKFKGWLAVPPQYKPLN